MSDYIRQQIEQRRAALAELRRKIEIIEAQLHAYEDSLEHGAGGGKVSEIRASNGSTAHAEAPAFGGPQVAHWPAVIESLASFPSFKIGDVERELRRISKPIKRKSVRAKLAKLTEKGSLRRISEGVYKVVSIPVQEDA